MSKRLIREALNIPSSEITSESIYKQRRRLIQAAMSAAILPAFTYPSFARAAGYEIPDDLPRYPGPAWLR
ncbi:MAG: mononuclear molybdenum enzyme YedY, partial [Amphritea sp.]|nr:mononuclear molybdenum enzyme YedY [Amphritea sp.]